MAHGPWSIVLGLPNRSLHGTGTVALSLMSFKVCNVAKSLHSPTVTPDVVNLPPEKTSRKARRDRGAIAVSGVEGLRVAMTLDSRLQGQKLH